MKIIDRLRSLMTSQKTLEEKSNPNIYEGLGIITPFTALADMQLNSFIGALASNKSDLNAIELPAFNELWNAACIDMAGSGNNIWNLREGRFEIYKKDGIIVEYEKQKAQVESEYPGDEGRANFVYLSGDGNFIINQNDRNNKIFLVYVSEDISDRLYSVLRKAEAEALELKLIPENDQRNRLGIPKTLSIAGTEPPKIETTIPKESGTSIPSNPENSRINIPPNQFARNLEENDGRY